MTNDWLTNLDGLPVLTNASTDTEVQVAFLNAKPPRFEASIVDGSLEAVVSVVRAIAARRSSSPGGMFRDIGDLLAVPELSDASPWLNRGSFVQLRYGISDAAYEALPSQLLPLLRPDPIGIASIESGQLKLRFSGFTGYPLALEASPNLQQWMAIQTNTATATGVEFAPPAAAEKQFFRVRLTAP